MGCGRTSELPAQKRPLFAASCLAVSSSELSSDDMAVVPAGSKHPMADGVRGVGSEPK
jgi:hypothetical protein